MIAKVVVGLILAVIGGIITFLFWSIEKKIDRMEKKNDERRNEELEMRKAERELLLAEASISALSARCIRGEHVNGDLEKAENYLEEKKHAIQNLTQKIALEHMAERG